MGDKFIKQLLLITLASLLIIPVISIRNRININTEYKTIQNFISSYLLFDLHQKALYSEDFRDNQLPNWHDDHFSEFDGNIHLKEINDNFTTFELSVKWPKTPSNLVEFDEVKINTKLFNDDRHSGIFYE
ncbi:MAG: hypothetical protein ACQESP_08930 [Candidatus Muiribacteriota bacterium]